MPRNPLNLVSRTATAVVKAGLDTLAGAERQGAGFIQSFTSNGSGERRRRKPSQDDADMPMNAWRLLEGFFDQRIARALNALQIPTSNDIHELTSRVEALTARVAELQAAQEKSAAKAAARPKPRPARKKRATTARAASGKTAKNGADASQK